jgi:hypothetical protein
MTEWRCKDSTAGLSWQPGERWGQPEPGNAGEGGSSPDKAGTCWYCQTVRVRQAETERHT